MKYLKTYEGFNEKKDLALEIAEDLLPKLKEIKKDKGIFTVSMFDNYMEERKANMKLSDSIMSYLVDMGFDFDTDEDVQDDDDMIFKYSLN